MNAWFEAFFGDDYFEIYRDFFPAERTAAEVEGAIALLRLQPGARVLDLACGHGRHAIPLAKRGFDVTGYDLSHVFLQRAQVNADEQGVTVRWVHGDMRRLPFDGEFDAVVNIFTAFGYFEDADDDGKVLDGIRRALKPGGRFLLETLHRDGLPGRFRSRSADKTSNGAIVLHETAWDLAKNVIDDHITLVRPDGTRAEYKTAVRLRSLHEFLALARDAGLEPTAWYGGLDGRALTLDSQRLALVGARR